MNETVRGQTVTQLPQQPQRPWRARTIIDAEYILDGLSKQKAEIVRLYDSHIQDTKQHLEKTRLFEAAVHRAMHTQGDQSNG